MSIVCTKVGRASAGLASLNPFLGLILPGQLSLELPKEVYERTGLVGHVIQDGGRKHIKTRYGASALNEHIVLLS